MAQSRAVSQPVVASEPPWTGWHALIACWHVCSAAQSVYAVGYGAVLDSGTTFTYFPTTAFNSFTDLVSKAVEPKGLVKRPGADPQVRDGCSSNSSICDFVACG